MVMWGSQIRCQRRFSSDVLVKDWLAAPTKLQQQWVDEMVALLKDWAISEAVDLPTPLSKAREPRSAEKS